YDLTSCDYSRSLVQLRCELRKASAHLPHASPHLEQPVSYPLNTAGGQRCALAGMGKYDINDRSSAAAAMARVVVQSQRSSQCDRAFADFPPRTDIRINRRAPASVAAVDDHRHISQRGSHHVAVMSGKADVGNS